VVIPGSVADLKAVTANGDQAPYLEWAVRNRELVERVRRGEGECCGECRQPGYRGWCSLLGLPLWFTDEGPVDKCPRAVQEAEQERAHEAWIEGFFSFLEGLESGNCFGKTG
jgi:hypothetical protein